MLHINLTTGEIHDDSLKKTTLIKTDIKFYVGHGIDNIAKADFVYNSYGPCEVRWSEDFRYKTLIFPQSDLIKASKFEITTDDTSETSKIIYKNMFGISNENGPAIVDNLNGQSITQYYIDDIQMNFSSNDQLQQYCKMFKYNYENFVYYDNCTQYYLTRRFLKTKYLVTDVDNENQFAMCVTEGNLVNSRAWFSYDKIYNKPVLNKFDNSYYQNGNICSNILYEKNKQFKFSIHSSKNDLVFITDIDFVGDLPKFISKEVPISTLDYYKQYFQFINSPEIIIKNQEKLYKVNNKLLSYNDACNYFMSIKPKEEFMLNCFTI